MKTIEDFKKAAKKLKISRWNIHQCTICGYQSGFVINLKDDEVNYDNGCNCVWGGERPASWEELAEAYNRNAGSPNAQQRFEENPRFGEVIEEQNNFWGFKNPEWLKNDRETL